MKKNFLGLVALCILAACAARPDKNPSTNNPNAASTDVQCHTEQSTVSLIAHTVCTTKAQRDAQHADLKTVRDVVQRPIYVGGH